MGWDTDPRLFDRSSMQVSGSRPGADATCACGGRIYARIVGSHGETEWAHRSAYDETDRTLCESGAVARPGLRAVEA